MMRNYEKFAVFIIENDVNILQSVWCMKTIKKLIIKMLLKYIKKSKLLKI